MADTPHVPVTRSLPGTKPLTRLRAASSVRVVAMRERMTIAGLEGVPAGLCGERPEQLANREVMERRR